MDLSQGDMDENADQIDHAMHAHVGPSMGIPVEFDDVELDHDDIQHL